ncbi:M20 family metallopeptidase [Rhodohalobacter barkolensis]|uniref:Carboxypeptidase n=1 Tax=Rhodohalobacter barkolensis TaxID=2053187 RepID=A0A2N0VIG4_9BACT|nr:M20 family metallopeptidase [Rhodohalobacter barkolensis]PKD43976.1 carboxypeptidase [Rhodohalobacter barkolensis]
MNSSDYGKIKELISNYKEWFINRLRKYVEVETPTGDTIQNRKLLNTIAADFRDLGFEVEWKESVSSAGQIFCRLKSVNTEEDQLMIGHADTVWPVGTLEEIPWKIDENVITGPGVYDMKSGIVMMQLSIKVMKELGLNPVLRPVVMITSDEETGSRDSWDEIEKIAKEVKRVFVPEPSIGLEGKIKTQRKGSGRYQITVKGREAHSGVEPEKGVSAVVEMSTIVQNLDKLNDYEKGVSLNVGMISGGKAVNVVPGECTIHIDLRFLKNEDGEEVDRYIKELEPQLKGAEILIEGGLRRPPIIQNERNEKLWKLVKECANQLDLSIEQGLSGGGSDGSITSQFTATIDGMGPVGEGAHSPSEKILVHETLDRASLLTAMLLADDVG